MKVFADDDLWQLSTIEVASLTDGTTIKLRSHQKWLFEIIDGKILITSSEDQVEGL